MAYSRQILKRDPRVLASLQLFFEKHPDEEFSSLDIEDLAGEIFVNVHPSHRGSVDKFLAASLLTILRKRGVLTVRTDSGTNKRHHCVWKYNHRPVKEVGKEGLTFG